MKPRKSRGSDSIYARVFNECNREQIDALLTLYRSSLETGTVPKSWRTANVVPIFKKGDKSLASKYRPISLTSIVGKLLESIIATKIREHLDKHNLVRDTQHGLTTGRSCLTNPVSFFSKVFNRVEAGKDYDIVYLDFSKAFDRVPYERLIKKVEAHGILG